PSSAAFFAAALALASAAFSARAWASGDLSCFGAFSGLASSGFLAIELVSGTLGDAHDLAVLALAGDLESNARRLTVLAGERDVGNVDRQLLGDDAALLLRRLLLMALDHVDAANGGPLGSRIDLDY